MSENKIQVFLSRPNPFTQYQSFFIKEFTKMLKQSGFECVTLQADEYSPYEVMTSLREMIQRSYGIIVLAFGQTFINEGVRKKDAEINPDFFESKEIHLKNKWITSVYCHIEGILALTFRLPMLTIPQENITKEGILKQGEYSITAPEFELNTKDEILHYLYSDEFQKSLQEWKTMVEQNYKFVKDVEHTY